MSSSDGLNISSSDGLNTSSRHEFPSTPRGENREKKTKKHKLLSRRRRPLKKPRGFPGPRRLGKEAPHLEDLIQHLLRTNLGGFPSGCGQRMVSPKTSGKTKRRRRKKREKKRSLQKDAQPIEESVEVTFLGEENRWVPNMVNGRSPGRGDSGTPKTSLVGKSRKIRELTIFFGVRGNLNSPHPPPSRQRETLSETKQLVPLGCARHASGRAVHLQRHTMSETKFQARIPKSDAS